MTTTSTLTSERIAEILDDINTIQATWRDSDSDRSPWDAIVDLPEYDGRLTHASFHDHDGDHAVIGDRVLCWVADRDRWVASDTAYHGIDDATIVYDGGWWRWTTDDDGNDICERWMGDRFTLAGRN